MIFPMYIWGQTLLNFWAAKRMDCVNESNTL